MRLQLGPRTLVWVLLTLFASTLFVGCPSKIRPLTIDDLNEFPPQRQAAITLSDPQIYSRESLVNDRRREAAYLTKLIKDSEDAVFEPQIRRDLRTLTATVLQLQAGFDPLAGRQAERSEGLAEIDNRIAETARLQQLAEARIKLVEAERRLDELVEDQEQLRNVAAADTGDDGGDSDGGDDSGDDGSGGDDGDGGDDGGGGDDPPTSEDLAARAKELRANVDDIKKLITALPSTSEVRQTAVGATPREIFRDRQAYRGELRGALAEVELDDAHDQGQNSLYRLQFRATVLPGRNQAKMGVARLTLTPPQLDQDDVLELYKTWLGHLTYRLNQTVGDELHHDRSYLLLSMGLDRSLFHSTDIDVGGEKIFVALPPKIYAKWKEVTRRDLDNLECRISNIRKKQLEDPLREGEECSLENNPVTIKDVELLRELSYIEPFMSASIRGLSDMYLFTGHSEDCGKALLAARCRVACSLGGCRLRGLSRGDLPWRWVLD